MSPPPSDHQDGSSVAIGRIEVMVAQLVTDFRSLVSRFDGMDDRQRRTEVDQALLKQAAVAVDDRLVALEAHNTKVAGSKSWVVWGQSAGAIVSILGTIVVVVLWLAKSR